MFAELAIATVIVIVILIIVKSCRRNRRATKPVVAADLGVGTTAAGAATTALPPATVGEHFTDCANLTPVILAGMCGDDDKFSYAINEFGAPGLEFKDWVTSQSVDPQVLKNHAEFVRDRISDNPQNITGRTYSPDMHDSYDPIPWVGLRRPQAVPVCNPTQVPDVDYNLYESRPKFTWRSS
jgi:hypothetical protein